MGLSSYKQKRDFKKTPEPAGGKKKKNAALGFVVQRHDASHLHYDFRLEMKGVLKSWAVPKGPSMKAGEKRLAVQVEDHPLDYGGFYGEIPEGNYGAGTVAVWDNGTYTTLEEEAGKAAEKKLLAQLQKGDLKFTLYGTHLKGSFALVQIKDGKEKNWLLIKKKDKYALPEFDIEAVQSLKSPGRKKAGTAKKIAPVAKQQKTSLEKVWKQLQQPMLAKLVEVISDKAEWLYELKYDGYRAIAKISQGKVELLSRNGNSFNKVYQPLVAELSQIADEVVLDGEVVIENEEGNSDFQLLQNYTTTGEGTLKYYVFDILFVNGFSVTDVPLRQRKELLKAFFQNYAFTHIFRSSFVIGKGENLFKTLSARNHEGIIAKDMESRYLPGKRVDTWLKVKNVRMQEAVIGGYTLPQKSRKYIGSLILGVYEEGKLVYAGNCGTGFTDASLKELHTQFEKLRTDKHPFAKKPAITGAKGKAVWLKPRLVCQVKFLAWTQDDHLRNPVFMGLRADKPAMEVTREYTVPARVSVKENKEGAAGENNEEIIVAGGKKVKLTNPGKIYWPDEGITKKDLVAYYQQMGPHMLPYLKNRPQSLNRHPNGISGGSFYQKDMDEDKLPEWAKSVKLYSTSNKDYIDYLVCNNLATLLYMANLGCIEINPWHSRYTRPEHPDYLMLDLDPGEIAFTAVVDTALVIKELCDETGMPCYCKTSGATGLHIYIPLEAKYDYDEVKTFAELLASIVHERLPDITSIERAVATRKDKIYVDFLQNRKGQTIAAPYSVRPRPLATVSAPLLWKEVNHRLSPEQFTMHNMADRFAKVGDVWKGVTGKGISLAKVLRKIGKL